MSKDVFHETLTHSRISFSELKKSYDEELKNNYDLSQDEIRDLKLLSIACENISTLLELIDVCGRIVMDSGCVYGKALSRSESMAIVLNDSSNVLPEWFPNFLQTHIEESRREATVFETLFNDVLFSLNEQVLSMKKFTHADSPRARHCLSHAMFEELARKGAKLEARNDAFNAILKPYENLLCVDFFNEAHYRTNVKMEILIKVRIALNGDWEK